MSIYSVVNLQISHMSYRQETDGDEGNGSGDVTLAIIDASTFQQRASNIVAPKVIPADVVTWINVAKVR